MGGACWKRGTKGEKGPRRLEGSNKGGCSPKSCGERLSVQKS